MGLITNKPALEEKIVLLYRRMALQEAKAREARENLKQMAIQYGIKIEGLTDV